MKIARFMVDGYIYHGEVDGEYFKVIEGDIFSGNFKVTNAKYHMGRVKLLPPTNPINFWGVGENYAKHVAYRVQESGEHMLERAKRFTPWQKGTGAMVASGDSVVIPPEADFIDYEGELCVVIGKPAFRVSKEDAPNYIFGYTCSNDFGAGATWSRVDSSLWRVKTSDTFAPVGPWIETDIKDPHNLDITVRVDGKVEDVGNTRDMVHNCYQIISNISQNCTLRPGDMITTGAPGPTRPMKPGEVIEVEIREIGVLRNTIAAFE